MASWKLVFLLSLLGLINLCNGLMCYTCSVTDCHDSPPHQCSLMRNLTLRNGNMTTLTQIPVDAMPPCPLNDRELRWNPRLEHFMRTCSPEFQVCGTYFMRLGASMTRHYVNQSEFDILAPPKSFHASLIVMGCAKSPEAQQQAQEAVVEATSTTTPQPTATTEVHGIHHKAVGKLFAAMAHPDLVHPSLAPETVVPTSNATAEHLEMKVPKSVPQIAAEDPLPLATEKRVQPFMKDRIKAKRSGQSGDESDPNFDPMARRRKRDVPVPKKSHKESIAGLEQVQVAPSQAGVIFANDEAEIEDNSQIPAPPTSNETSDSAGSAITDSSETFDLFEPEDFSTNNETSTASTWLTSLMDNFWSGTIEEEGTEEATEGATTTSPPPKSFNNDDCPQIDSDDLTWVGWMWEQMFGDADDIKHCLSCPQSFKVTENETEAEGKRLNEVHQFVDFRQCAHCSGDFCNSHIPYELDTFRSEVEKDHKPPAGGATKEQTGEAPRGAAAAAAAQVARALVLSATAVLLLVV